MSQSQCCSLKVDGPPETGEFNLNHFQTEGAPPIVSGGVAVVTAWRVQNNALHDTDWPGGSLLINMMEAATVCRSR